MNTYFSKLKTDFAACPHIQRLWKRSTDLSKSGKRNVYVDNPEFLVYHWSGRRVPLRLEIHLQ
jgi:formate C-acetyltransferase